MLHTLDVNRLPCDRCRHEIKCALGYVRQYLATAVEAVRTEEGLSFSGIHEPAAAIYGMLQASFVSTVVLLVCQIQFLEILYAL